MLKRITIGLSLAGVVILSQLALFWGLDALSKQMLLPNIVFEQPYWLHGETRDLQGEFALSADSHYLAWINGGVLYVEDLILRQRCNVGELKADLFVWLPDRSGLVFISDNQLFSLSFEGEIRLSRETEACLAEPAYTYSHIAVSTNANLIYLLGTGLDGEQDVVEIDLSKRLQWLERVPGARYSRLSVSNRSGVLMLQAETSEGARLFVWQGDSIETVANPMTSASAAEQETADVLLGADGEGFYVGRLQKSAASTPGQGDGLNSGFTLKALFYYGVDVSRNLAEEPVVLWQGDIPASAEFMPFAVGVGLLVSPDDQEQEPYLLKMIWGANHQMGAMERYPLKIPLLQANDRLSVADEDVRLVFATNGLTYLEIKDDMYCWRLLQKGS